MEQTDYQYESLVSWYWIENTSNYPGPKGKVIPYVKGYEDPNKYEGTELYIHKNTKGYKEYYDNQSVFTDYEGNSVPWKKEYFKLNPRMMNEDIRMQFLAGLITESQYKDGLGEIERNGPFVKKYDVNISNQVEKNWFQKYDYDTQYEIGDIVKIKDKRKIKTAKIIDKIETKYKNVAGGLSFIPHTFKYMIEY
jgi:hypothetical protein